jgi:hypothetical protein
VLGAQASVTLDVFNLFNRKVNDIQYFYESQLPGESRTRERPSCSTPPNRATCASRCRPASDASAEPSAVVWLRR